MTLAAITPREWSSARGLVLALAVLGSTGLGCLPEIHTIEDMQSPEELRAEAEAREHKEAKKRERRETAREVAHGFAVALSNFCYAPAGDVAAELHCAQRRQQNAMEQLQAEQEEAYRDEQAKNRETMVRMHDDELAARERIARLEANAAAAHAVAALAQASPFDEPAWSCWIGTAEQEAMSLCYRSEGECAQAFLHFQSGGATMYGGKCIAQTSVVCVDAADGRSAPVTLCSSTAELCGHLRARLDADGWAISACSSR